MMMDDDDDAYCKMKKMHPPIHMHTVGGSDRVSETLRVIELFEFMGPLIRGSLYVRGLGCQAVHT